MVRAFLGGPPGPQEACAREAGQPPQFEEGYSRGSNGSRMGKGCCFQAIARSSGSWTRLGFRRMVGQLQQVLQAGTVHNVFEQMR